jgi:hypothetical protein
LIPCFRTSAPEWSANLLLKHYRSVLIRAAYANAVRIRFRADHITDERVFFDKVPSQRLAWIEQGGALISYKYSWMQIPHDAIVFAECPKYLWMMARSFQSTRSIAVIYEPPTWRPHEVQIEHAVRGKTEGGKFLRRERFMLMRAFVEQLPELTAQRLETLIRRARAAASRSSSFPSLSGAGARLPDTHD